MLTLMQPESQLVQIFDALSRIVVVVKHCGVGCGYRQCTYCHYQKKRDELGDCLEPLPAILGMLPCYCRLEPAVGLESLGLLRRRLRCHLISLFCGAALHCCLLAVVTGNAVCLLDRDFLSRHLVGPWTLSLHVLSVWPCEFFLVA